MPTYSDRNSPGSVVEIADHSVVSDQTHLSRQLQAKNSGRATRGSVAASGLQLLRRADIELQVEKMDRKRWILAESIRRTVMTSFMLFAIYSVFRHGVCIPFPTLSIASLPVSAYPVQWKLSSGAQQAVLKDTMKYEDYTGKWVASPQVNPEPCE